MTVPSSFPFCSRVRSLVFGLAAFSLLGAGAASADSLPASYNINEFGWLTPVKDQENLGTCWAFANTTTFEISLLKLGLVPSRTSPEVQLSEWHLATANGNRISLTYDRTIGPNGYQLGYTGWGGMNEFAIGYWTRGRGQWAMHPTAGPVPAGGGPVWESSNPYNAYPVAAATRGRNLAPYVPPASQSLAPFMLSQSVRVNWNGEVDDLSFYQERVKEAVTKYGGLTVYVDASNDPSNSQSPVWYNSGTGSANHAVTLVGWDDNKLLTYNGQEFLGGWFLQNSWGVEAGTVDPFTNEGGYYWVPFADSSMANVKDVMAVVARTNVYAATGHEFAPTVVQNQIFAPLNYLGDGMIRRGYSLGETTLAASKQIVQSNSAIGAIGLWQGEPGTKVDIRIYDAWGPTGPTGNLLGEQNGVTMNMDGSGYNMIDLDVPIFLAEGKPLYVMVDYGDEYNSPILVDSRTFEELTPEYGTYLGLSWMSTDGVIWDDLAAGQFDFSGVIMFMKVFRLNIDLDNNHAQFAVDPNFDFTVDGLTQTATDSPTISGLRFEDGGILNLNSDLTVTEGTFGVHNGYATGLIQGDHTVFVTGNFFKTGAGALVLNSAVNIAGDANIGDGSLFVASSFTVDGALEVNGGFFNLLDGGSLTAEVWNINSGLAWISGGAGAVNALSLRGGQLLLEGGAGLSASQMDVSGGVFDVYGVSNVNRVSVSGGLVNVYDGGVVNAGSFDMTGGVYEIWQGGVTQVFGQATVGQSGSLIVNDQFRAPQLVLAPGGLLSGAGSILGDVVNGGMVSPGNSPGTLTVSGNYTQTPSGSLFIEVASESVFDRLVVGGVATLGGDLVVIPYGGYAFEFGQSFAFLEAGSINGVFDEIILPENFRGRLIVDDGTASVLVAPTSYTLVAATQNQRNVADALDSFIPATSGDRVEVSTALDYLTAQEYPAAFNAISPAFYESLASIGIEQAFSQGQQMQQRFRSVQLGVRGFQSSFDAPAIKDNDGKTAVGPDGKAAKDILAPTADNKWGAWVQGNGLFARNASVNNVPKYNFNSGGFLGGVDYSWTDAFTTGLYAGYQGTYAKYDGGGTTIINSTRFGGYASYGKAEGFFANTMVGGGYSGYQVSRPIEFGSIDRTARSRPYGGDFESMLNAGYNWQVGRFNFGLSATGQYTYLGIAPFTENGADSLDLSVDRQHANSLRTLLGGQIAYTWQVTDKLALIPQGSLYWQHEFMQYPRNIGASLDGGSGPSFDYSTASPARDSVYAGAGLTAQFGDRWNANFYYNANFGRQDFVSHMITTGLEVRW